LAVLVALTGCQSPYTTNSDKTIQLRVPKGNEVRLYQVLRTNSLSADQKITVKVLGRIHQPGTVALPKGSTMLEAIIAAGGFDKAAVFWKIAVTQGGRNYTVGLHQVNDWRSFRCFAWYGKKSDFLLEDGADIEVRFWPPAVREW
jgi:hypothetical protein